MRHPQGFRFFDAPVRDQEVEGSNPFAPTTFKSRSHINLNRNCFFYFCVKNLSKLAKLVQQRVFRKCEAESNLGRTLLSPPNVVQQLLAIAP